MPVNTGEIKQAVINIKLALIASDAGMWHEYVKEAFRWIASSLSAGAKWIMRGDCADGIDYGQVDSQVPSVRSVYRSAAW